MFEDIFGDDRMEKEINETLSLVDPNENWDTGQEPTIWYNDVPDTVWVNS